MKAPNMSIGIEDLRISLSNCPHNFTKAELLLSFELEGDFLAAIDNDDLEKTIDYDVLSQHLCLFLSALSCQDSKELHECLINEIRQFSSLITRGFIKTTLSCHAGFINQHSLL